MRPMNVIDPDQNFISNTCILYDNQVNKKFKKALFKILLILFIKILTGGNKNRLFSYSFDNKLKREIVTTSSSVYDISINYASKSNKVTITQLFGVFIIYLNI